VARSVIVSRTGIAMIASVKSRKRFGESPEAPESAAVRAPGGVGAIATAWADPLGATPVNGRVPAFGAAASRSGAADGAGAAVGEGA